MQVGNDNIQINVVPPVPSAARSGYLFQVRALAPDVLVGREKELAALEAFCTRPDTGSGSEAYLWWRAGAWAGKTALMSWFVLHPPADTRIVSFFVTARLAAQSDREAFLDVVIEQLAALLGEPVSPYLTAATRPAHLWALLDTAAVACRQRGQRLVLVVDGLDEDSGATAHSIAALLPARPTAGLRIVVAGRHDPPVPPDVPDSHPLRDPAVRRALAVSPHAGIVRSDAERELKRLLRATTLEQDLLGLVATAVGGLSGRDLAELTGARPWEIEEVLQTVTGRTFTRRPAFGSSGAGEGEPDAVYLLGHEELQRTAVRFLGKAQLAGHRQRLHDWADGYRDANWPAGTPGYLFRGYFRMLHADGDLVRMTACALDPDRHARMRELSGADAEALAEIAAAQDALLGSADPDLTAMTLLAFRRDTLTRRNTDIPAGLPAVWALLGRPGHARMLARSIPSPDRRVFALGALGEALADRDWPDAVEAVGEAESVARGITNAELRARALAAVARSAARIGDAVRAEALAREAVALAGTVTSPELKAGDLAAVAQVVKADEVGDLAREAEAMPVDEVGVYIWAMDLKRLAGTWPRSGDVDRAESLARGVRNDRQLKAIVLAATARMAVRVGDAVRAGRLARDSEALSRTGSHPQWKQSAEEAHALAAAVARSGDAERAEALARTIPERPLPYERSQALKEVARILAQAGEVERALAVVDALRGKIRALAAVACAVAATGDTASAAAVAHTFLAHNRHPLDPGFQAYGLADVAMAMAEAGDTGRAEYFVREAESAARALRGSGLGPLVRVAEALISLGRVDRARSVSREAETLAWSMDGLSQFFALVSTAALLARLGEVDRSLALARTPTLAEHRDQALAAVVRAVAEHGDVGEAEDLARGIANPRWLAWALAGLAEALARAGLINRAVSLAREAEALSGAAVHPGPRARAHALLGVAEVVARAGSVDRAEAIALSITAPDRQAEALAGVARHAEPGHARRLTARVLRLGRWHLAADLLAGLAPDVLTTIADDVLCAHARTASD